jgi:hypothetical protein
MSVYMHCFIEVKDKDGKWNLVKWYTDEKFDKFEPNELYNSFQREVEINGVKTIENIELWPGHAWRDELSWCRGWGEGEFYDGLPKDISEELNERLTRYAELYKAHCLELGYSEEHFETWGRRYSHIYLSEMRRICDNKMKDWRRNAVKAMRDVQFDSVSKKLDRIEKIASGKEVKPLRRKKTDEEVEEDMCDYYLDENIEDIIALRRDLTKIDFLAGLFVNDDWVKDENVRIIYYFD